MASTVGMCSLCLYLAFLSYGGFRLFAWVESRKSLDHAYPVLSDFSLVPVGGLFLTIVHRVSQWLLLPLARSAIVRKGKWSEKVYDSKVERFGSAAFKLVFFILVSTYSWKYGLADADWVPPAMFGKGSTKNCWGDGNALDTQQPVGAAVKLVYQLAMAYHLQEVAFQFLFERDRPDFTEMSFHHITTLSLVISSFYGNMIRVGTLVLLVHYVSDISSYATKMFVDTSYKTITFISYLGILASWGYLRLYAFPVLIIRSTLVESTLERVAFGEILYYSFNLGLGLLLCLHCYWYIMFLQMGYNFLSSGETKDMQANLASLDSQVAATANGHAKHH